MAAEVFVKEIRRMQQLPQEQMNNQAAHSRLPALNSNVDRLLETFRQVSENFPIFGKYAPSLC